MKHIIAEIDRISNYIEDFEEPWAFNVVWRLDKVAQQLGEIKKSSLSKISKNVLNQYMKSLSFLSENSPKLTEMIQERKNKKASEIYTEVKKHFGNLSKREATEFIKNILKNY